MVKILIAGLEITLGLPGKPLSTDYNAAMFLFI